MGKGRNTVPQHKSPCARLRRIHRTGWAAGTCRQRRGTGRGKHGARTARAHAAADVEGFGGRAAAGHDRAPWRGAGRLPGAAGPGGDSLSAGGRCRHGGPHPVPEARRHVWPAIRHRQARRRRRHHRRRRRGQGRSRRLHHHVRRHRPLGESVALFQSALRHGQGLPAGLPRRARHQSAGGQQVGRGEDRGRRDRARQGDAGRPRLGVVGQRHGAAPRARNVQASGRHQAQPHPLSRRRSGAQRPDRRTGEVLFLECRRLDRARAVRGAQMPCPYRPGTARDAARCAGGGGDVAGLRSL